MDFAKQHHVRIYPVDSEHSAIFQSLQGNADNRISRILLTASGGLLPRQKARGAGACNGGGCTGAPELAHGQEDYD